MIDYSESALKAHFEHTRKQLRGLEPSQRTDDVREQARSDAAHERAGFRPGETLEQKNKREMIERNRNAWRGDATATKAQAPARPAELVLDQESAPTQFTSEDEARRRMLERNRDAWKGTK